MSAGLAEVIRSLSENENAATRALLLIGADQLGMDPTSVADDLRMTISARLPSEVCALLLAMWSRVDQSAVPSDAALHRRNAPRRTRAQASTAQAPREQSEETVTPSPLDPFSTVGFDFDEGG
jgi:hypothetical protein